MISEDLTEVRLAVARIEVKLDRALGEIADHDRRVQRLERLAAVGLALALAGGAASGALTSVIS